MAKIQSRNPATGELLAEFESATEEEVRQAVAEARSQFPPWSSLSFKERGNFLLRIREQIRSHLDELAHLISQENGKPLVESISADLFPVMDLATYFAKNAEKILRREKIWLGKWSFLGRSSFVEYEPRGVVGIIGPWNFPFSIPFGQALMALIAGNVVVMKTSEFTPQIGLKFLEIAEAAELPKGVLQVILGDGATGATLVQSGVDKILFTGSTPTGKKIMELAAKTLTPVALEMGGKDPMIVLEDADLEVASSAAVWGSFTNAGQVCSSVERLYLHEKIAEPFLKKMIQKSSQLRTGNGAEVTTEIGPMTMERQRTKVGDQVTEAIQRGARKIFEGEKGAENGFYYPLTVLEKVDHEMAVMREETFGPVIGTMTFQTNEEAVRLANESRFGLTASIWTKNFDRGIRLAREIEAGTVTINENLYTYALAQTPWGGPKESSLGRTHGRLGLLELVQPKHIHLNRWSWMKDFWWYRYDRAKYRLLTSLSDTLFGKGVWTRLKGAVQFIWYRLRIKNL